MLTRQQIEDLEQESYNRGYMDCEYLNNFFKRKIVLTVTHSIVAIVFFIMGLLYTTK